MEKQDVTIQNIFEKMKVLESNNEFMISIFKISNSKIDTFIDTTNQLFESINKSIDNSNSLVLNLAKESESNSHKATEIVNNIQSQYITQIESKIDSNFKQYFSKNSVQNELNNIKDKLENIYYTRQKYKNNSVIKNENEQFDMDSSNRLGGSLLYDENKSIEDLHIKFDRIESQLKVQEQNEQIIKNIKNTNDGILNLMLDMKKFIDNLSDGEVSNKNDQVNGKQIEEKLSLIQNSISLSENNLSLLINDINQNQLTEINQKLITNNDKLDIISKDSHYKSQRDEASDSLEDIKIQISNKIGLVLSDNQEIINKINTSILQNKSIDIKSPKIDNIDDQNSKDTIYEIQNEIREIRESQRNAQTFIQRQFNKYSILTNSTKEEIKSILQHFTQNTFTEELAKIQNELKIFAEQSGMIYKTNEESSNTINRIVKDEQKQFQHFIRQLQSIQLDIHGTKFSPGITHIDEQINKIAPFYDILSNKQWQQFLETHKDEIIFGYGCMQNRIIDDVFVIKDEHIYNANNIYQQQTGEGETFPNASTQQNINKPALRRGMTTTKQENQIYLQGGQQDKQNPYFCDLWKFNCDFKSWELVSEDWGVGARSNSKMTKIGSQLFMQGGFDQTRKEFPRQMTVQDIEQASVYTQELEIPSRENHVFQQFSGRLWVGFGFNGRPLNDLWQIKVHQNFSQDTLSPSRSQVSSPKGSFISPRIEVASSVKSKLLENSMKFEATRVVLPSGIKPDRAMDSVDQGDRLLIFGGKDHNLTLWIGDQDDTDQSQGHVNFCWGRLFVQQENIYAFRSFGTNTVIKVNNDHIEF